jgi:hypothetical protein
MEYTDDILLRLKAEGRTLAEIARLTGATRGQVSGRLKRIKRGQPARGPRKLAEPDATPAPRPPRVRPLKPDPGPRPRGAGRFSPNQTIGQGPGKKMTRTEMYEMLRQAVENTK